MLYKIFNVNNESGITGYPIEPIDYDLLILITISPNEARVSDLELIQSMEDSELPPIDEIFG